MAFVVGLSGTVVAHAASSATPRIEVRDGVTQPVFSADGAVTERVYVQAPFDSDADGRRDRVAVRLVRPAETAAGLKVPVLIHASPYWADRAGEDGDPTTIVDDQYVGYFVPRGYAVAAVDMVGTNQSQGCPDAGGPVDVGGARAVVDWLAGRATAYDRPDGGRQVRATWTTGRAALYGGSYDGTLANGVAATGVPNLRTIVSIAANSSMYDNMRFNGMRRYEYFPRKLVEAVVSEKQRSVCEPAFRRLDQQGAESGDYTKFWHERNYVKDVARVRASVFLLHGLYDNNVYPKHYAQWWEALGRQGVPRRLWLGQMGHTPSDDFRFDEFMASQHRWFDRWLYDVANGTTREPTVEVQGQDGDWQARDAWPVPDAGPVDLFPGPADVDSAGTLTATPAAAGQRQRFTDDPDQTRAEALCEPMTRKKNRLAYVTAPLARPVHLSGTPRITLRAAADRSNTQLTVKLIDIDGRGECAQGEGEPTLLAPGWLDGAHRESLLYRRALTPHQPYLFAWDLMPLDYVIPAGHRIGLVIQASDRKEAVPLRTVPTLEVLLAGSSVRLPVVGGQIPNLP